MRMYDLRIFIQILFNVIIDGIFVSRYLSPFTTAKVFQKRDSRHQSHRFRESFLHCFLIIQFVANHAGHSVQASLSEYAIPATIGYRRRPLNSGLPKMRTPEHQSSKPCARKSEKEIPANVFKSSSSMTMQMQP